MLLDVLLLSSINFITSVVTVNNLLSYWLTIEIKQLNSNLSDMNETSIQTPKVLILKLLTISSHII